MAGRQAESPAAFLAVDSELPSTPATLETVQDNDFTDFTVSDFNDFTV